VFNTLLTMVKRQINQEVSVMGWEIIQSEYQAVLRSYVIIELRNYQCPLKISAAHDTGLESVAVSINFSRDPHPDTNHLKQEIENYVKQTGLSKYKSVFYRSYIRLKDSWGSPILRAFLLFINDQLAKTPIPRKIMNQLFELWGFESLDEPLSLLILAANCCRRNPSLFTQSVSLAADLRNILGRSGWIWSSKWEYFQGVYRYKCLFNLTGPVEINILLNPTHPQVLKLFCYFKDDLLCPSSLKSNINNYVDRLSAERFPGCEIEKYERARPTEESFVRINDVWHSPRLRAFLIFVNEQLVEQPIPFAIMSEVFKECGFEPLPEPRPAMCQNPVSVGVNSPFFSDGKLLLSPYGSPLSGEVQHSTENGRVKRKENDADFSPDESDETHDTSKFTKLN
jgi:hypothetical protein